jgi:hypothetical protein
MKTKLETVFLAVVLVLGIACSASGIALAELGIASSLSGSTLAERLKTVEVVAIINVTNVTKTISTNAAGSEVVVFMADAKVERLLKGKPPEAIRIRDESHRSLFSADNFFKAKTAEPRTNVWMLGTSRFLVFLNRAPDSYAPSVELIGDPALDFLRANHPHLNSLAPIWGTGLGTDRVTWPVCSTIDEAVSLIQKALSE